MYNYVQDDPLEGIRSKLVNDENMFEWEVALFGPPETLYEGGYFKVRLGMSKFMGSAEAKLTFS